MLALGDEEPHPVAVAAELMNEVAGQFSARLADIDGPCAVERGKELAARKADMLGAVVQSARFVGRHGVKIFRRAAHEYQSAARTTELTQPLAGCSAKCFAAGNDHNVVFHPSHGQRRAALGALGGKQGFGDKVEIDRAEEQPFGEVLEVRIERVAFKRGL